MLDLTKDRVDKVLVRFILPMFISVIFQQMYNMADSLVYANRVFCCSGLYSCQ